MNPVDTYIAQLQGIANRLRNGTINTTFAASELDRINSNYGQGNNDAADAIEATIQDIQNSKDDIAAAVAKVSAVAVQLTPISVDPIAEPPLDVVQGGV
jgi:methyl-accepting chemotaxis protein